MTAARTHLALVALALLACTGSQDRALPGGASTGGSSAAGAGAAAGEGSLDAGGAGDAGGAAGTGAGGSAGASGEGGVGGVAAPGGAGGAGAGACDLSGFAEAVRTARAEHGSPSTCASPLPMTELASDGDARAAVREFVAGVVGAPAPSFEVMAVECGTATTTDCARHFQHDVWKSNGILGERLLPAAERLWACADAVEETIWVPEVDGITGAAVVCISGVWNQQLVGIAFFNEVSTCP